MPDRPIVLLSKVRDWLRTADQGWLAADHVVHMRVVRAEQKWALRLTDDNGDTHLLHPPFATEDEAVAMLDALAGVPPDGDGDVRPGP